MSDAIRSGLAERAYEKGTPLNLIVVLHISVRGVPRSSRLHRYLARLAECGHGGTASSVRRIGHEQPRRGERFVRQPLQYYRRALVRGTRETMKPHCRANLPIA